jgi:hypothetical protein
VAYLACAGAATWSIKVVALPPTAIVFNSPFPYSVLGSILAYFPWTEVLWIGLLILYSLLIDSVRVGVDASVARRSLPVILDAKSFAATFLAQVPGLNLIYLSTEILAYIITCFTVAAVTFAASFRNRRRRQHSEGGAVDKPPSPEYRD